MEMVNVLTIDAVIHDFLNEHLLDAVVVRRCFCKKGVLKKKETLLQEFEFHETFKTSFLIEHPRWLLLAFSLPFILYQNHRTVKILLS